MSTTEIQIIAAVGAVIVLAIIIWRRKSKAPR
jgi:subtilase family serine protease